MICLFGSLGAVTLGHVSGVWSRKLVRMSWNLRDKLSTRANSSQINARLHSFLGCGTCFLSFLDLHQAFAASNPNQAEVSLKCRLEHADLVVTTSNEKRASHEVALDFFSRCVEPCLGPILVVPTPYLFWKRKRSFTRHITRRIFHATVPSPRLLKTKTSPWNHRIMSSRYAVRTVRRSTATYGPLPAAPSSSLSSCASVWSQ